MTTTNKLTTRDVIDIRRMYNLGDSSAKIAEMYGVTQRTIQRVISGEIWSSVPLDRPIKGFGGRYDVTVDGRIWSYTKKDYVATNKGMVRLTNSGKKATLDVGDIVKKHFS